jgi:tRNA (guanine-N7-)-methyltransferase
LEKKVRSYVIRKGRISSAQSRSYETLFPVFGLGGDHFLDSSLVFGNDNPIVVEIGFGMGTATAIIAGENPELNYLGIEVHMAGIGKLLWNIEKMDLKNIRIIEGDAADIINKRIKDNTISAFHIFFPDPWPKKRHHKRRLIKRPFTDSLAAKLIPSGYIYMVSDWEDYGNWALFELSATPGLANKYDTFAEKQSWRPETEFERKGIKKNHNVWELFFVKNRTQQE